MKRSSLIFVLLLLLPTLSYSAKKGKEIVKQQSELDKITTDLNKNTKKLDSLKRVEETLNKRYSQSNQKISSDKKVINRLGREMGNLQSEIKETEGLVVDRREDYKNIQKRYLGNIREFYIAAHRPGEVFSEDPNKGLILNRQKHYLTALAGFESANIEIAKDFLVETESEIDRLGQEKKNVNRLKKKKESAVNLEKLKQDKQKKDLRKLQKKKTEVMDKIQTMQHLADEMESRIARIQDQLASQNKVDSNGPSFFKNLKGQMNAPFKGKVIQEFGNFTDKITKLKFSSSGITIQGKAGNRVIAVASGTIAHVGHLRGYGNFIIINHDNRFYSTYAGLDKIDISMDEYVLSGAKLGVVSSEGLIRFEIRDGNKAVDPVEWIRYESF